MGIVESEIDPRGASHKRNPSLASPRLGFLSYPTPGTVVPACANMKKPLTPCVRGCAFAVWTGLEPATPCVTGRYSNQLNYQTVFSTYEATATAVCEYVFIQKAPK